jgi:hypothetical protein
MQLRRILLRAELRVTAYCPQWFYLALMAMAGSAWFEHSNAAYVMGFALLALILIAPFAMGGILSRSSRRDPTARDGSGVRSPRRAKIRSGSIRPHPGHGTCQSCFL